MIFTDFDIGSLIADLFDTDSDTLFENKFKQSSRQSFQDRFKDEIEDVEFEEINEQYLPIKK